MEEKTEVQFIRGNDTHQEDFIDLINYVFNLNVKDNDFYHLLPKLYKREYHPCEYNYLALENNRIKAAVGAFTGEMNVCGTKLSYTGIGNVAVNPYSRSKGYMKKLMDMALENMLIEDMDFSLLGGNRQRYSYFSYEIAGRKYDFRVDGDNVKHTFGSEREERFQFKIVGGNDREELQKINDLQISQPLYYKREMDKLYDILKSWNSVDIYSIYEGARFAGYLLFYDNNSVQEILLHQQEDVSEVIADFLKFIKKDGINIEVADYQRNFVNSISTFAGNVSTKAVYNFSVFHYGKVIEAFLRLKAQTDKLADGAIALFIHGKKADEKLLISVKDNQVSVTDAVGATNFEYSHLEAMSVLFQSYSPLRSELPFEVQTWLPLPIHIFKADEV